MLQSRRYRNFESYLLPKEEWGRLKRTEQTRLVLPEDAQTYLAQCNQQMQEKLDVLKKELPKLTQSLPGCQGRAASGKDG